MVARPFYVLKQRPRKMTRAIRDKRYYNSGFYLSLPTRGQVRTTLSLWTFSLWICRKLPAIDEQALLQTFHVLAQHVRRDEHIQQ